MIGIFLVQSDGDLRTRLAQSNRGPRTPARCNLVAYAHHFKLRFIFQ